MCRKYKIFRNLDETNLEKPPSLQDASFHNLTISKAADHSSQATKRPQINFIKILINSQFGQKQNSFHPLGRGVGVQEGCRCSIKL